MRFSCGLLGVLLLFAVSNASVVQRRIYRNTEEILVPVTIIQDGEEIREPANLKENEKEVDIRNPEPENIAQNLAIPIEGIEKNKEILEDIHQVKEAEQILDEATQLKTTLPEAPEIVAVLTTEDNDLQQKPVDLAEKYSDYKSAAISAQVPEQVVVVGENSESANSELQQPGGLVRQATQATPAQTTTQQNFVQQLIQNSPLGQFFNQITGQTTQQVANDETAAAPVPTLPGLFNPVTAVQNAAQSVVNSTTQGFQGLQQFASNLGNQFQSTLSGLGGLPQQDQATTNDATTPRPPGPIQQLVNTFLPQQTQPAPAPPGPLQGLLNIFQGNRPQTAAGTVTANTNSDTQPETNQQQTQAPAVAAAAVAETIDQTNNEVRDSGEANDSFEESVEPEELIIVNDEVIQTTQNDSDLETTNN